VRNFVLAPHGGFPLPQSLRQLLRTQFQHQYHSAGIPGLVHRRGIVYAMRNPSRPISGGRLPPNATDVWRFWHL